MNQLSNQSINSLINKPAELISVEKKSTYLSDSIQELRKKSNWGEIFADTTKFPKELIDSIDKVLEDGDFYPFDILRAFSYMDILDTKVVILGQEPYYNNHTVDTRAGKKIIPYANGLSFGYDSFINTNGNIEQTPAKHSIKRISQELGLEYGVPLSDTTLESWATQGVLMLNSVLTVKRDIKLSHSKAWYIFIMKVIKCINICCPNCVFIVMGKNNHTINSNLVISVPHPSPNNTTMKFIGCNCFKQANLYLKNPIKWV